LENSETAGNSIAGSVWNRLVSLIFIVIIGGCNAGSLPTAAIDVAGFDLIVEIADTQETRSEGLMFRRSMDDNHGMLFIFEYEHQASFWMKNTTIPLSIAFIAADGTIRQIEEMEPESLSSVASRRNILYALEVNQGWFEERGIYEGDKMILPLEL
jgi:uncharacterized membrane protein (UPF0127 family)